MSFNSDSFAKVLFRRIPSDHTFH